MVHLLEDSPPGPSLGRLCDELDHSYSWPTRETPRLSEGKRVIECSIEISVPVVAPIKQKAVPSIEFSSAKGKTLSEKEKWRTPCWSHSRKDKKQTIHFPQLPKLGVTLSILSKENFSKNNLSGLSPLRSGRRYSGKRNQEKERNHRFPTKRKSQCVHSLSERSQL